MKLHWKIYLSAILFITIILVTLEFGLWPNSALQKQENENIKHVEGTSSGQEFKEYSNTTEILDGEFTIINKEKDLNDEEVVKNEEQADTGIEPSHIEIPAIDVNAPIEEVGVLDNGEMGVPDSVETTGWFEPGTQPGNTGNAVIAGHVDSYEGPAVFFYLDQLTKGDEIIVRNDDGEEKIYEVERLESYPMDDAPIEKIFGQTNEKRLNLITCTGEFIRDDGGHQDRLVVYTKLKKPETITALSPPTNVESQGTFVKWHSVRDENVAGYRVYKSEDGENFEQVASISNHERKTYTDQNTVNAQFYITTVDQDGNESPPSETISIE